MTLMSQKIGQDATRRCDARCYGAKHSKCHCICGGLNHGAGLQQALTNVRDTFLPVIEVGPGPGEYPVKVGREVYKRLKDERQRELPMPAVAHA